MKIVPHIAVDPGAVRAALHYRSHDQGLANLLLGAGAPKLPVI